MPNFQVNVNLHFTAGAIDATDAQRLAQDAVRQFINNDLDTPFDLNYPDAPKPLFILDEVSVTDEDGKVATEKTQGDVEAETPTPAE
jgi:hypothetical protein